MSWQSCVRSFPKSHRLIMARNVQEISNTAWARQIKSTKRLDGVHKPNLSMGSRSRGLGLVVRCQALLSRLTRSDILWYYYIILILTCQQRNEGFFLRLLLLLLVFRGWHMAGELLVTFWFRALVATGARCVYERAPGAFWLRTLPQLWWRIPTNCKQRTTAERRGGIDGRHRIRVGAFAICQNSPGSERGVWHFQQRWIWKVSPHTLWLQFASLCAYSRGWTRFFTLLLYSL